MSPPEKRAILTEQQVQQVIGAQGRIELDGGLLLDFDFWQGAREQRLREDGRRKQAERIASARRHARALYDFVCDAAARDGPA